MKTTKTIILFFFLSLSLQAQWQKTDYGFVSNEPVLGEIRWIPEQNAIISAYIGVFKKMDLSSGEIINTTNIPELDSVFVHISDEMNKSIKIRSKALFKNPKVFLVFDFTSIEIGGTNDSWKDSLLLLDDEHYNLASYNANLVSLNDSIVAIGINYKSYAGQEYWKDFTLFYNVKTRTYNSQSGIVQSFNPLSNTAILKNIYKFRDYPDYDVTKTFLYSYNLTNGNKNTYSELDHEENENVTIGNAGTHALFFNKEYQMHFKNGIDKPELVYKGNLEAGKFCLSDDESFVIRLNSNSKDSKLTITQFGTAKAIDSISFQTKSELTKILFVRDDYVYFLDKDNYLNKVGLTDFTTDVETQTTTPEIEVYPNPITDVINIRFSNMMQVESLEIYGMTGNLVQSINYSQYTNNIPQKTENLTSGVYIVKIITTNGVFHKKIIKF